MSLPLKIAITGANGFYLGIASKMLLILNDAPIRVMVSMASFYGVGISSRRFC